MVNHVGNQNRPWNDPFSNTYNPGWKQHPKFSWGGQNNRPYGNQNYGKQHQEEKSSMEQMMQKFISSIETRMKNQDASIKNFENQIGQLAKAMSSRDSADELRSGKRVELERQEEKEPEDTISEKTAALMESNLDSQFAKFLEVFNKLNINIPFSDALMQMPSYAKFLKEILSNKRKLEENAMISLTENSLHWKLSLGEPKPTRMSFQLADRSLKYPRGIIEDVLVKVDKFIFPVDFVVLDMEEDLDMPLIMGRPFLETGKALIDVQKRELLLRVGEEKISFDVFNALKCSQYNEECFQIDAMDSLLNNYVQDTL
ncbi:uncharacterized protein [Henckelia pumila]|uniref:uncharacterized protein n=1 Tax=Henckelia pumila TaxID=405737 RepID=UPI003C6E004C